MGNPEHDQDLIDGLKAAKGKRCYFAVAIKGGSDGAMVVSKQKIQPADITAAKKKSGGSAVVTGACFEEDGKYIFEVAKIPAATVANVVKLVAKRDAGLTIQPVFRLGDNPDLLDGNANQTAQQSGASTSTPQQGQQQPQQQSNEGSNQTSSQETTAKSEKYERVLNTWEQASAAALAAVDTLSGQLEQTGDDVALAIASIIQKMHADFPDTVDDSLANLADSAKAGNAGDTENYRNKSEIAVRAALSYLNNNAKTIDGCEQNPFGVSVAFRAPLTAALKEILIAVKR